MWMKNSVDPRQLASNEASRSGPTLFSRGYKSLKKLFAQFAELVE